MKLDYTKETKKSFDEAVDAVVMQTEKLGFKVLYIHDVQKTLKSKGLQVEPLKIIEVCNAKNAYQVISNDIAMGLFLPCKINVYIKSGKTYISGLRPMIMAELFPHSEKLNFINDVDKVIQNIITNSI